MTNIEKFIDFLSHPGYHAKIAIAKSSGTCVLCGQAVNEFSTKKSAFEYRVSSLCEKCQDTYIHNAYRELVS